jgi:hypothetical protein
MGISTGILEKVGVTAKPNLTDILGDENQKKLCYIIIHF